jgi:hypothetical protein
MELRTEGNFGAFTFRFITAPILKYIRHAQRQFPGRKIAVAIQELVASHWYQYLLHNHQSTALKGLLLVRGNRQVVMVNVRARMGGELISHRSVYGGSQPNCICSTS